jgi:F0F1-type ATP synthase membrane subunit a
LVLLLVHFVTKKGGGTLVPNAWQSLVEFLYDFVWSCNSHAKTPIPGKPSKSGLIGV